MVTHPDINPVQQGLTSVKRREPVFPLGDSRTRMTRNEEDVLMIHDRLEVQTSLCERHSRGVDFSSKFVVEELATTTFDEHITTTSFLPELQFMDTYTCGL